MTASFGLVGGGAVAVDRLVFVNAAFGDGKGRVLRQETRFGGNIATAMVAAVREGVSCAFIGSLPDEAHDDGILNFFRAESIDLSAARISADTAPIRSLIVVGSDGSRFIAYDDATPLGLPDDLDLEIVRAAKVLLVDAYGPTGAIRAARAAREAGVAVVADIEHSTEEHTAALMDLTDHLVLPMRTALDWTYAASAETAVDALWTPDRTAVIVTDGANGCWFRDRSGHGVRHQAARTVEVVDTTGCGDVFHGTYAAALAQGRPIDQCVARASATAAECATHPGGIPPRATPPTEPASADRRVYPRHQ